MTLGTHAESVRGLLQENDDAYSNGEAFDDRPRDEPDRPA